MVSLACLPGQAIRRKTTVYSPLPHHTIRAGWHGQVQATNALLAMTSFVLEIIPPHGKIQR